MSKNSLVKIFVVEDDEWYREYLSYTLSLDPDHLVKTFETAADLYNSFAEKPDIITVDYGLPDFDGSMVLKEVRKKLPDTEVIIISEQDKIDTALTLLKDGAYDYFVKSKEIRERLLNTVQHIKNNNLLKQRIHSLEKVVADKHDIRKNIVGNSAIMEKVFDLIEKTLNNNLTVTITGETGTGKEEVAKSIHYNSIFKDGPFVALNMAAIPKELAESELFGHEKGAFTGAVNAREGKFEEANGGTLFLDEIGDIDPSLQVKLLRVLQEKVITKIGSNKPVKVNCRVIVATHKDLLEEVNKGNFREDLYYRIFGLTIQLPNLRDRGQDIILLSHFFAERFCKENKLPLKKISADASKVLLNYSFPGNVRELKSVIELACVLSQTNQIESFDLNLGGNNTIETGFYMAEFTLDDYTRKIIRHYLDENENNVTQVAKVLNIGKTTIYRMMKDEKGI